uniref:Uncharacterized protein n=1 Tax=Anguilla anguilla TaxID=7936 RepID=A0A0E9RUD7_ANGAN
MIVFVLLNVLSLLIVAYVALANFVVFVFVGPSCFCIVVLLMSL